MPIPQSRRRCRSDRRANHIGGFTLVELLVVIGIIALLIGITLPMVSKLRKAAYVANTQQMITRIAAAIDRYAQDFHGAYPGPFRNEQCDPADTSFTLAIASTVGGPPDRTLGVMNTPPTPDPPLTGSITKVSSTENLVLGLLGGLRITVTASTIQSFGYDFNSVGNGPVSLNPLNPKQYPPYLEVDRRTELARVNGSNIPVLTDRFPGDDQFPSGAPILYLRAKPGAPAVIDGFDANGGTSTGGPPNTNQYNMSHIHTPYAAQWPVPTVTPPGGKFPDYEYLANPSLTGTPQKKDAYILISPGKDRKYGTGDDICNFGNP